MKSVELWRVAQWLITTEIVVLALLAIQRDWMTMVLFWPILVLSTIVTDDIKQDVVS